MCRYDTSIARKQALEEELADLEGKLERAEKLVTGLAGERVRWEASISGACFCMGAGGGGSRVPCGRYHTF